MNLDRRDDLRYRAAFAAIATAGGAGMAAALLIAPVLTLVVMAVCGLAIVQGWRMAARVRPPGGER